ncbi:hypothetical protein CDAR_501771 [Caerostris darwini]|uniref:Uncharacterized protein n=1 Tax=Caerostris darwini TaxID=1538125 RepID=A0AAV4TLU1_9ARAC|nr:hypothetical protein CDAR_501771 [Caerostris darwini]
MYINPDIDPKRKENYSSGSQTERQCVIGEDIERHKRTIPEINSLGTHLSRDSAENISRIEKHIFSESAFASDSVIYMDPKRKENFLQGEQIKRQSVIGEDMEPHKRRIPEINYLGTPSSRGSAENMGALSPPPE